MFGINLHTVQARLDRHYPGSKVRGAFLVNTRSPQERESGCIGPTGTELDFVLLPLSVVGLIVQTIFRWRKQPDGTWHVLVLTDHGIALAHGKQIGGPRVTRWIHGPTPGLRYELDPGDVTKGFGDVEITLGDQTLWASGQHRDSAFRLFAKQAPPPAAPPPDPAG